MFLFDRNSGFKYEIWWVNSLAVKIYQFYTELFKFGQQKMNLKYQL